MKLRFHVLWIYSIKISQSINSGWLYSCGHWIIVKERIFSIIFAKNPVKSILPIWPISRNTYFSMFLAYMRVRKMAYFRCVRSGHTGL